MKIVAIMGGGDWVDADVKHLEIPDDMNLKEMGEQYRQWLKNEYHAKKGLKFLSFPEFLKTKGALDTDKIEEYWEY